MNTLPDEDNSMRFSLFQAWLQNKQTAMQKYFPAGSGESSHGATKWMDAGSRIAAGLEERPLPVWLADVTPADISEYRIIEEFDGLRIRGTLDKFFNNKHTVVDNKSLKRMVTAKEEKTLRSKLLFSLDDFTSLSSKFGVKDAVKYKAQLVYYQVLVEQRHGHVDPTAYIEVIPVWEDSSGLIRRTGEAPDLVPLHITDDERSEMRTKMIATAKEISIVYQAYLRGDIKL